METDSKTQQCSGAEVETDFSVYHAFIRGLERYGVRLTDEDEAAMTEQVREARAIFITRARGKTTVWLAYWPSAGRIVPLVYSRKKNRIVTILPPDAREVQEILTTLRPVPEPRYGLAAE